MKNVTTYLGCIALALFVVYLCTNMLSLNNKIVEGLISKTKTTKLSPDELLKEAQSLKTILSDDLNIKKYGDTYKKLLVTLEDIYHLAMISAIKDGGQNGRVGEINEETINNNGILKSPKAPDNLYDEFPPTVTRNGLRRN